MARPTRQQYFWTKWHWADHTTDTSHLTLEEEGAYMRLLRLYYNDYRGPLPADVELLCRKVGARTDGQRAVVATLLQEFFHEADGFYQHSRCDRELASVSDIREQASNAGKNSTAGRPRDARGRLLPKETSNARWTMAQRSLVNQPTEKELKKEQEIDKEKEQQQEQKTTTPSPSSKEVTEKSYHVPAQERVDVPGPPDIQKVGPVAAAPKVAAGNTDSSGHTRSVRDMSAAEYARWRADPRTGYAPTKEEVMRQQNKEFLAKASDDITEHLRSCST